MRRKLVTWLTAFLLILVFLKNPKRIKALMKFTSLKCDFVDKEMGELQACRIKAVSRKKAQIFLNWTFKKTITNCLIQFQFSKKTSSGHWHPFLYNGKMDVCDYFLHPTRYPVPNLVFYYMKNFTNFNHTCPFKSVEQFKLDYFDVEENELLKFLPVEVGDYGLNTAWYTNNKLMLTLNATISYSNYRVIY